MCLYTYVYVIRIIYVYIISVCGVQETQSDSGEVKTSIVERLFGCEVESVSVCRCGWSSSRRHTELLFSLTYPPSES